MAKFVFYRYSFEPIEHPVQTNINVPERLSLQEAYEKKSELLWDIIMDDEKVKLYRGSRKTYSTKSILREDGIYILHFANKKIHGYELDFNHLKQQEEPSCIVMLDNRTNMQYIAVEKKTTAFTSTDTVATSFQKTFNKYLEPFRLRIEVRCQYRKNLFWKVVESCKSGVKMVRFNFPFPNMPEWSDQYDGFEKVYMERLHGKVSRQYIGLNGEPLVLDKNDEILQRWNSICEESAEPVDVLPIGSKKIIHCNASYNGSQVEETFDDKKLENIAKNISTKQYTPRDAVSTFMNNHKHAVDE